MSTQKQKTKTNQEEKRAIARRETIIAILFAVLIVYAGDWVANYAHFEEKYAQITKQEERLSAIKASNQLLEQVAANLPLLEKQSEQLDVDYKALAPLIPEKRELPSVLEDIQHSAMSRKLRLDDFAPSAEKKQMGALAEIPIKAQVTGDEVSLRQYLLSLNRFNRILHINSLDIATIESGELTGNVKAVIELSAYVSNAEIKNIKK